jgi:hypothetical protein
VNLKWTITFFYEKRRGGREGRSEGKGATAVVVAGDGEGERGAKKAPAQACSLLSSFPPFSHTRLADVSTTQLGVCVVCRGRRVQARVGALQQGNVTVFLFLL